ncbi:MAG: hypothetical protein IJ097_00375 [Bacilli bacterium]|nr:hypothetical protein [Bacilli bacterium]
MSTPIMSSSTSLNSVTQALETAGKDYREKLARVTALIEEITRGDIQGDPATDLLAKFNAKQDIFKGLAQTLERAEEEMRRQEGRFNEAMDTIMEEMR